MSTTKVPAHSAVLAVTPDLLMILPVRGMVLFPGMVFPITVGRPRWLCSR